MADVVKIKDQIKAILGVSQITAGVKVYSSTVVGDADWLNGEIDRAIVEAQYIVAEAFCRATNPKLRSAFLQTATPTSGDAIPNHYGEISKIAIVPYSGAAALKGVRKSAAEIASYRANISKIHSAVDHNVSEDVFGATYPSCISGQYAIDEDIFTFTGFSATYKYADFSSTALSSYPVSSEVPITHIAIGLLAKDGTISEKFGEHLQIGMSVLNEVATETDEENTRD
jgi:hypothetical protein